MKTKVIVEEPVFILNSEDYNDGYSSKVYISELKKAEVGDVFESSYSSNCGRAVSEESIQVVFKNRFGCAVVFRREGTTDSPNPRPWKNDPELIWVEFGEEIRE